MEPIRSSWFTTALPCLIRQENLASELVCEVMQSLTSGLADPLEIASFLTAMSCKGESTEEIVAATQVLRQQMIPLHSPAPPILDTCGTGGDGSGTFNISTAVSLVLAGAGVRVVKHGNRSASSKTGSADVLSALGVPITQGPAWAQNCLDEFGFAFCFAPQFHPSLAHVGPIRRKLGIRTIFNLLGPLLNPAKATHQLLGVAHVDLLDRMAEALLKLGTEQAFVVRSQDGLDEVSLSAPTEIRFVHHSRIESLTWTCEDFGLQPVKLSDLQVEEATQSARIIQSVLIGEDGPARRIVLANAAAGLFLVNRVKTLKEGVALAADSIDQGHAIRILDRLKAPD